MEWTKKLSLCMLVLGCIFMLSTIIIYHVLITTHFVIRKPGAIVAINSLENFEFPSAYMRFAVESIGNYKLSLISIPDYSASLLNIALSESQHRSSIAIREVRKLSDRITNELSSLTPSKMTAYGLYHFVKTDLFESANWKVASARWNKFLTFNNPNFTRAVRSFNGIRFITAASRAMALDMLEKAISTSSLSDVTLDSLTEDTLKALTDSRLATLANATDLQLYTYLLAGGLESIG